MWAFVSLLTVSSGVSTVCHQRVPVHGGATEGAHTQIYVQHQGQLLNQNYYWHEWQETRLLKAVERMPSAPSSILNASPPLYEVSRAVSHSSVWYLPCSPFVFSALNLSSLHAFGIHVQMLKQLAWEAWFQYRVTTARERELETLSVISYLTAFSMLSQVCVPFLVRWLCLLCL